MYVNIGGQQVAGKETIVIWPVAKGHGIIPGIGIVLH
jgi:hypothetical protein